MMIIHIVVDDDEGRAIISCMVFQKKAAAKKKDEKPTLVDLITFGTVHRPKTITNTTTKKLTLNAQTVSGKLKEIKDFFANDPTPGKTREKLPPQLL